MTKEELSNYARDNRERLKKQEVKLGDIVEVLNGHFAGERGIVKQIMACGNDFDDPYFALDMQCEVPKKYRKYPDNPFNKGIIGGLSNYDFEVIGHAKSPAEILEAEKEMEEQQKAALEEMNNPQQPKFGEIRIPLKVDYDDSVWQTYRMELAKEVVKVVYHYQRPHKDIIDETMQIVDGIVERLKKTEE